MTLGFGLNSWVDGGVFMSFGAIAEGKGWGMGWERGGHEQEF